MTVTSLRRVVIYTDISRVHNGKLFSNKYPETVVRSFSRIGWDKEHIILAAPILLRQIL